MKVPHRKVNVLEGAEMVGQTKSKQRVADHGEVFTAEREVKAMCDLVKQETERIESRFLEPACGNGNFLAEILSRKLAVVKSRSRLFVLWDEAYTANNRQAADDQCREAVRFILEKNILCGDALTLRQADGSPIIFAEWSFVTGNQIKRRDFALDELLNGHAEQMTLDMVGWEYDEEVQAFIPAPIREFPLTDYRRVQDYE